MRNDFFVGYDDKHNAVIAYIERYGENNGRIIVECGDKSTKLFSEQRYEFDTHEAYKSLIAAGYKDLYLM